MNSLVISGDLAAIRPSIWRRPVLRALSAMKHGRLDLTLPDGAELSFGGRPPGFAKLRRGETVGPTGAEGADTGAEGADPARVRVRSDAFFARCALYGDIGFAESYLDGEWDSEDLTAVIAWFVRNVADAPGMSGSRPGRERAINLLRWINRAGHWLRGNTSGQARRNIGAHYDLSNEFFALFLDPTLMYSAAKWTRDGITLEEAQREKNDLLCRKLRLGPGDHVLEIGSGWGGWAIQAARTYGCRVTSITLSRQQQELARLRIAEAGLAERVQVELRDYRDISGRYDKIVSIEMMEAIGHRYLPHFCSALDRALRPGGVAALQFITCPDSRYEKMRRGVDFIQKHIFPGSLLLSLNRVGEHAARAGDFVLRDLEDLGHDYALTLRCWRERFLARLPAVRELGFDERFIRKWTYYLCYCEAAFAQRNISVVQAVYTRPNQPPV